MDKTEKLLEKIPKHDRILIEETLKLLFKGKTKGLNKEKLKAYNHIFRIRIRNYRIIYYEDDDGIILKAIKRKNEKTYNNL